MNSVKKEAVKQELIPNRQILTNVQSYNISSSMSSHPFLSFWSTSPPILRLYQATRPSPSSPMAGLASPPTFSPSAKVSRRTALGQAKGAWRESAPRASLGLLLMGNTEAGTISLCCDVLARIDRHEQHLPRYKLS